MQELILLLHVCVCVALIALVLLQQGKGAEAGAAFGGGAGASQTFFGSQGATSFLVKFTAGLATVFFVTSLTLGIYASKNLSLTIGQDVMGQLSQPAKNEANSVGDVG